MKTGIRRVILPPLSLLGDEYDFEINDSGVQETVHDYK